MIGLGALATRFLVQQLIGAGATLGARYLWEEMIDMATLPYRPEGEAPDWLGDSIIGWNPYNPLYQVWQAFSDADRMGELENEIAMRDLANAAGEELISALCSLTLPDYNAAAVELDPYMQMLRRIDLSLVPPWFGNRAERSGALTPQEYIQLRADFGCPVPVPSYTQTPPIPTGQPSGLLAAITRKPSLMFGGVLVVSGLALGVGYLLLKPKTKTRRRKRLR